jgi:hypothetical protein
MFTPHPSYQPMEYMACGCIPVVEYQQANGWLLQDNKNAIIVENLPKNAA